MPAKATKQDVAELVKQLQSFGKDGFEDDSVRLEAMEALSRAYSQLETPPEFLTRTVLFEPASVGAILCADDLGLFRTLAGDGEGQEEGKAQTVTQLATAVGADPQVIRRLLRPLVRRHAVTEVNYDTFVATRLGKALAKSNMGNAFHNSQTWTYPGFLELHRYLAKSGYKNPDTVINTPLTNALGTDLKAFDWFAQNPAAMQTIQNYFSVYASQRASWIDVYPVESKLLAPRNEQMSDDDNRAVLVDIGGGFGHDIMKLLEKFPLPAGKLVLQEQAAVIKGARVDDRVVTMEYDFFSGPNPVQGARGYYLHHVLHNWPDEECRTILKHTKASMQRGYSKLYVFDNVLPPTDASLWAVCVDLTMMIWAGSLERTEDMWRELFASVGLKLEKVWSKSGGEECVLEVDFE